MTPVARRPGLMNHAKEVDRGGANVADDTARQHVSNSDHLGRFEIVVHDGEHHTAGRGSLHSSLRVGRRRGEWFLTQDVLSGFGGGDEHITTKRLRRTDVDDVDVVTVDQVRRVGMLVRSVQSCECSHTFSGRCVGVGDCDDLRKVTAQFPRRQMCACRDVAAADDPDVQGSAHQSNVATCGPPSTMRYR